MTLAPLALVLGLLAATPPAREAGVQNVVAENLLSRLGEEGLELKTGGWVTYRLHGGPGREAYWRIAVVGEEADAAGRPGRWIELDFGQHPNLLSPLGQLRLLMSKTPSGAWTIRRLFVGVGAAKPSEVEPSQVAMWTTRGGGLVAPEGPRAKAPPGRGEVRVVRGRSQRLMTQAGSVLAEPVDMLYRGTVVRRIWVSEQIPVLQLVKIELPGIDHALEVRDYGIDARAMMVLPAPDAPKITLESPGELFPAGPPTQEARP